MTFCQSCSMPIDDPAVRGTNADGSVSEEFCTYCYQNGSYTNPEATMEEMIQLCIPHMVNGEMTAEAARTQLETFFPQLKRWQKA